MNGRSPIAPRVQAAALSNGAPVYLLENHAGATLDIVALLDGGLTIEPARRAGVAALTFDMLDRGTRRRDEWALAEALEGHGARLRYDVARETAVARARALSEDEALLIELLGETLREPSFPEDALRRAREETLVGLREAAADTFEQAYRRAAALLLGADHAYAREPDGEEAIVAALAREELVEHHARAVGGARLTLAVVGDIDPRRTLALLEASLGPIGRGAEAGEPAAAAAELAGPSDPAATGRGIVSARVPIPDKAQVDLVFMRPGVARTDPRFDAAALANFLLGGSFVSRLNQRLRDREGMTYGAESGIVSGRQPGCWFAAAGVEPDRVDRAAEIVREELRRFIEQGVGDDELARAKSHLAGSFPLRLETNQAVAAALLDCLRHGRDLETIDRYPERIAALTRAQVEAAGRELIDPDELVIVAAGACPA
ncbi:MAG: insulinase family protein [Candidatus Eisenbacteria bacterium]|uniref:Insulinase family protein n=1 Tax=Eiseniibacteriota bacterium TaxID=2212470 RepID=A0A938BNF9_UNCEI|nr:insulinase family protein [Candidatus Eisenbacteria bacterium]